MCVLGILQLRIYALYLSNKMVMRIMVAFFLASVSASSVIIGLSVSTFEGMIDSDIFKRRPHRHHLPLSASFCHQHTRWSLLRGREHQFSRFAPILGSDIGVWDFSLHLGGQPWAANETELWPVLSLQEWPTAVGDPISWFGYILYSVS